MKKNSSKRTLEERSTHERAVKLRKMTDTQLCSYIDGLTSGGSITAGVEAFIDHLDKACGTGNGIGKSTVHKLRRFAQQEGYIGKV